MRVSFMHATFISLLKCTLALYASIRIHSPCSPHCGPGVWDTSRDIASPWVLTLLALPTTVPIYPIAQQPLVTLPVDFAHAWCRRCALQAAA